VGFNVSAFAESVGLSEPVAGWFMEVENGINATIPTTNGTQLNVPSAGNGSTSSTSSASPTSTATATTSASTTATFTASTVVSVSATGTGSGAATSSTAASGSKGRVVMSRGWCMRWIVPFVAWVVLF